MRREGSNPAGRCVVVRRRLAVPSIVRVVTERDGRRDVVVDVLVAGTASLLSLLSPDAAVSAATMAPMASAGLKSGLDRISLRRRVRQEYVFQWAADTARLEPEELQRRFEADPDLEELLLLVMDAVEDTADQKKLVAYALILAAGAMTIDGTQNWQIALAETIRDLRPQHLALLDRFTWTTDRLGLANVREDGTEVVPEFLDEKQIARIGSDLPALPSLLAVLQRHGLLLGKSVGGGGGFGMGGAYPVWQLTAFGQQVHRLMLDLGHRLH